MADDKTRRRMVVEEVSSHSEVINAEPVEAIKEKVEELQTLTQDISQNVEKSAEVQEDLAKAAENVVPVLEPAMPEVKKTSGPNPLAIIIPGIFLLGALLGGIYFYQKGIGGTLQPTPISLANYNNEIVSTPQAASPSPLAALDLTKYPINVKNGSGIAGQAGVVKTLLTSAGFSVSGTGNASSYDFTKTVIKAKVDVPAAFLAQLTAALSKSYIMDTNQVLATSSANEVQVIIGSSKAQ